MINEPKQRLEKIEAISIKYPDVTGLKLIHRREFIKTLIKLNGGKQSCKTSKN